MTTVSNPSLPGPFGGGSPIYGTVLDTHLGPFPNPGAASGAGSNGGWISGNGAPSGTPVAGTIGYMDLLTGDLYRWVGGAWV